MVRGPLYTGAGAQHFHRFGERALSIAETWKESRRKVQALGEEVRTLSSSKGLHCVLQAEEMDRLEADAVDAVLKKSLLYAEMTILFTQPVGVSADFFNIETRHDCLRHRIGKIEVGNADSGLFIVPRSLDLVENDHDGTGRPIDETVFTGRFEADYQNPNAMKVGLDDAFVAAQLTEEARRLGPLKLWLPYVRGIDLDTLIRLRADEHEDFSRLHFALKSILIKLPEASGDDKVVEIGERVDHEIKSFEAKVKTLRKRYTASLGEITVGSAALGLCAMLPEAVEQIVSGIVGAHQIRSGTNRFIGARQERNEMAASDFHVAWLLHNRRPSASRN